MDLGLAVLRAQTRAAVSEIAELGQKDVERGLSCTLAQTSLLCYFGCTGLWKDLLSLLRPWTRAAHSRRRRRATLNSLGDSALRGERGKLLVLLGSSIYSYMVYILGLTVLGTVVRELGGLKCFKCLGGDAVTGARESGLELRKCIDSGSEGMGGPERHSWCSLGLCYMPSRCCSVSAAFDYLFIDISQR
jgi:hypothetical protein